jgi:uncharacterized membrane protein YbhN (UPF0104 family)
MLASDQAISEFALPTLEVRALARRAAAPALIAAAAVAAVFLLGGRVHAVADGLRRGLGVSPGWGVTGAVLEVLSLAGYVALLSLVAGRAAPRVGPRASAQITLAGAAATRLLPTAGAGGVVLTLWALQRAGLGQRAATRTLLAFLVLLYAVFLGSVVIAGVMLTLGLGGTGGPFELSALPAAAALLGITLALALAIRRGEGPRARSGGEPATGELRARIGAGSQLIGEAVRDACRLLRAGDLRLAGAFAYWAFDAAVLWSMLHAFGSPPALPVIALAYLVGQLANTIPLPGSVSGGMTGVLIAFGVAPALALPAVLCYRAIAVWLPTPVALAAVPALRATTAHWGREQAPADAGA